LNHLAPDIVENLVNFHGSRVDEVLATADEKPGERDALLRRLGPDVKDICVQVIHAVRHEMALHLEDVIFRRTGLGTLGHPGSAVISKAAELMARELEWDETTLAREIAETTRAFETVQDINAAQEGSLHGGDAPDTGLTQNEGERG